MNKNKSNKEDSGPPPNFYKFYLGSRERYIHINSNFESGNIQLVRQMSEFYYRLTCIEDGVKTNSRVNSKSWFYFSVHGFPKNTKGKFAVSRVQTLMAVYSNYPKSYRPVYRQCYVSQEGKSSIWSEWSRIPTQSPLVLRQNGQLQCTFDFLFKNQYHKAQFAFAYPYTYSENISFLNNLNDYYCNEQFYFHKEILIKSPEDRDIHLLTITSYDQPNQEIEEEFLFHDKLFPEKCRPKRFKKPVILITARVHPGQTAASFAMEGIISFLVNNQDVRSYLLKKMFVFMIVPMINVDGVFHGHFRMDGYGKNLNRYYIDPDCEKQPAIFAIKQLANHLIKDSRLSFYFDLHAHNAKKGAFIYGNAINDFVEQVQSQVFCKLFAMNNNGFQYQHCNFSIKQMNSKDRNQERTKEGCGRVVMHKVANIIHSYSLQCGIISALKVNSIPTVLNEQFTLGSKKLIQSNDKHSQTVQPVLFTENSYRQLGKSLLVSILDVFDKNPYNRVYNSTYKSLEFLRRVTAFQVFHTAERFRMFEKYVYGKVRNINELIKEVLNSKLHYRELYNFYFFNDKQLKNVQWPENIPGLVKPKLHQRLKRFRSLQQPKLEYSLSFINDLKANKYQLQKDETPSTEMVYENCQDQQQSYSSQTQDQLEQKQINEQYLKEMLQSYSQNKSELLIRQQNQYQEDNQSICSWRVSQTQQAHSLSPEKVFYRSQIDNESVDDEINLRSSQKFNEINQVKKINKLKLFERNEEFDEKQIKLASNQSPSVRVRRLLKLQNGIKRPKLTNLEMKDKLIDLINNSPIQLAQSGAFTNNTNNSTYGNNINFIGKPNQKSEASHDHQYKIFEEIKLEIKQELRRHKQRKGIMCSNAKPHHKKSIKGNISEVRHTDKFKGTNLNCLNLNTQISLAHHKHKSQTLNKVPSRSSITKTQLPALNSHILVITSNSSKGLLHNQ